MKANGFAMPSPTLIMAGVIVGLSVSNVFLYNLYKDEVNAYADYRATVEAQSEVLRVEGEKRDRAVQENLVETVNAWAAVVDFLERRPPIVRVRDADCSAREVPAVSEAAGGTAQLQASESRFGSPRTITAVECQVRVNGSIRDAIWIEQVKALTDQLHEVSK